MQNSETLTKLAPPPFNSLTQEGLSRYSLEGQLSLSLPEMVAIQNHFLSIGREPTHIELETIAQTWSEHCKHKTFRGIIDYKYKMPDGQWRGKVYNNLLKETIFLSSKELGKPFCLSVFEDNAGIIAFDKKWALSFKVETHNHPSALEPYGGSGTGIGGVIRDILGAGLGGKPICNTDVFCVGEFKSSRLKNRPDEKKDDAILPPEKILSGVISGVRDYGNRMGIPTSNGAVIFHDGFRANPLVFCGTLGLLPKDKIAKKVFPGDLIVSIGGRTGRDGIHGATFSSLSLKENISGSVVQIGNAIVEKKVTEVILRSRDKGLYHALTDCGAGGYSSAVGELASECGAKVFLDQVPLKYERLLPWEIWVSESQERMVLAIPQSNLKKFQMICEEEEVELSVMGEFKNDKMLSLFYQDEKVGDLDLNFLHNGMPPMQKEAVWISPTHLLTKEKPRIVPRRLSGKGYEKILKKLMAHPNIASKKWIIQQYDHEVQGRTVIKPLVGANCDGPSDASVFQVFPESWKGVIISNGINPFYGEIDPYWMAANAIDESLRNLVAVGGNIDYCAILDNFCWGDVHDPKVLGQLVRSAQGCYDFSKGFQVPFISGKDSLNNSWHDRDGKNLSIPGTLLISAISVMDDIRKCITMDFKRSGNLIAILGETKDEMGGSHFYKVCSISGGKVPEVNADRSRKMMRSIHQAIQKGLIQSCHDISEGGFAVSLAEMCLAGNLGAEVDLSSFSSDKSGEVSLFSESASRWIIEIEQKKFNQVEKIFSSLPFKIIGKISRDPLLKIHLGKEALHLEVQELKKLFHSFSDQQGL